MGLSLGDFVASSKALIEKWKEIDVDDSLPDWQWKSCSKMGVISEEEGYLSLEGVYHNHGGRQEEQTEDSNSSDDTDIVRDDTWVQSSSESVHIYDYHAVYSFSYKVPVLYFQGHQAGGQLLTLDEIKEDLPSHSLKLLGESKWTFITREEHPHFSRPWFTLHPCGTSDCMKLLLEGIEDNDQHVQYLPAWLSVVGQVVGLKIPLELYGNPQLHLFSVRNNMVWLSGSREVLTSYFVVYKLKNISCTVTLGMACCFVELHETKNCTKIHSKIH